MHVTQPSEIIAGKYRLTGLIARGGMAEVFSARALGVDGFEKVVVVKRLLPELNEQENLVNMFVKEARLAVGLSHGNIVQVLDLGKHKGRHFMVLEHVDGWDLSELLDRMRLQAKSDEQPPGAPITVAVHLIAEVARGLDYAHRRKDDRGTPLGIIHCDVSPQNILVSQEGEVKLGDFGIANVRSGHFSNLQEPKDGNDVLKGKYPYMAPEQSLGGDVDARADLFSLATVLYELLSGSNPFVGATREETLQRVRAAHVPPLHVCREDVPEGLAKEVALAMSADRNLRHPSMAQFQAALEPYRLADGLMDVQTQLVRYVRGLVNLVLVPPAEPSRGHTEPYEKLKVTPRPLDAVQREDQRPGFRGGEKTPVEIPQIPRPPARGQAGGPASHARSLEELLARVRAGAKLDGEGAMQLGLRLFLGDSCKTVREELRALHREHPALDLACALVLSETLDGEVDAAQRVLSDIPRHLNTRPAMAIAQVHSGEFRGALELVDDLPTGILGQASRNVTLPLLREALGPARPAQEVSTGRTWSTLLGSVNRSDGASLYFVHSCASTAHMLQCSFERAHHHAREALHLADIQGWHSAQVRAAIQVARIRAFHGERKKALQLLRDTLHHARTHGMMRDEQLIETWIAHLEVVLVGDMESRDIIRRGLLHAIRQGHVAWALECRYLLAAADRRLGLTRNEHSFREVRRLAMDLGHLHVVHLVHALEARSTRSTPLSA